MPAPTIRELIDDPVYLRYLKTVPRLPEPLTWGNPWGLWIRTRRNTWKHGQFATYHEGWRALVQAIRNRDEYADASLYCRRTFLPRPESLNPLHNVECSDLLWGEWCGRCRRPTDFVYASPNHHALRNRPCLTDDEPYRCNYCGVRKAAQPVGMT